MTSVTSAIVYAAGSRNEPQGRSGVAHLIEHMMFKGSRAFAKGEIDHITQELAGINDGMTCNDTAAYLFTFASDGWKQGLMIEADRMRGCLFDRDEFELEKQVVVEEAREARDNPEQILMDAVQQQMFRHHSYGHPVLGWPRDIENLSRRAAQDFYRRFYAPDNAILCLTGQFAPGEARALIQRLFSSIPARAKRPAAPKPEPRQRREQRLETVDDTEIPSLLVAYRAPRANDPAYPALHLLSYVLASSKQSRLEARLIEREQTATDVSAVFSPTIDPYLFQIFAEILPAVSVDQVLRQIDEEIARLLAEPVDNNELASCKARAAADLVHELEHPDELALLLAEEELRGGHANVFRLHDQIQAVNSAALRRAAQELFHRASRTVGWVIPREEAPQWSGFTNGQGEELEDDRAEAEALSANEPPPSSARAVPRALKMLDPPALPAARVVLPNGLTAVALRRAEFPTAVVRLFVRGGADLDPPGSAGSANLMIRCLREGTETRTANQITAELDRAGTLLTCNALRSCAVVNLTAMNSALAAGLDLLSDILLHPRFDAAEIEQERGQVISEIKVYEDDPAYCAGRRFMELIYAGHPAAWPVEGTVATLAGIGPAELRDFHQRHITPGNSAVIIVGDIEETQALDLIHRQFGGWSGQALPVQDPPLPPRATGVRRETIAMARDQLRIVLGHLGISRLSPDYEPLSLFDIVYGQAHSLTDRLQYRLRDVEGLVYGVNGGITSSAGRTPGMFQVTLTVDPRNRGRALRSVFAETRRILDQGISAAETALAKREAISQHLLRFDSNSGTATYLMEREFYGLPMDSHLTLARRLERISADQAVAAARRHISLDHYVLVEAGPLAPRNEEALWNE